MPIAKTLLSKMQNYCAYQERSQYEVRQKLFDEKVYGDEADRVISSLIEENFLSEERFALAYAGGKFRLKRWGKVKIKMGLRQKQVPEKMITRALNSIEYSDYLTALEEVIRKKKGAITEKNPRKRKQMLINYAVGRGFERELIYTALSADDE